jgi:hypothetical protein
MTVIWDEFAHERHVVSADVHSRKAGLEMVVLWQFGKQAFFSTLNTGALKC